MSDPTTTYEEWFVPALFRPLAEQTLSGVEIAPGARVLDVACGSGVVARMAARRVGSSGTVTGLDFHPAMLATARNAAVSEGLAITWVEGRAEDLPFADGAFDIVFCQMGLQFFPDKPRAAAEMRRVLAPDGQAVVSTWRGLEHNPFSAAWAEAIEQLTGSAAPKMPFSFGEPEPLRTLFEGAGFTTVRVEPVSVDTDYGNPEHYVERQITASAAGIPALQAMAATKREAAIARLQAAVAPLVREYTIDGRVRTTLNGSIVYAENT